MQVRAVTMILPKRHAHVSSADAAVATSAALNVTEPSCCGIGGSVNDVAFDSHANGSVQGRVLSIL